MSGRGLLILGAMLGACQTPPQAVAGLPDAHPEPASNAALTATTAVDPRHIVYRSHYTMGSQATITAFTAEELAAVRAFEHAFAEFDRLDHDLSVWQEESDISQLNRAAGQHPVKIAAETLEALQAARQASEWTGGKFDVTFGALSGLWKFDHDQDNTIPSSASLRARKRLINYRDLIIDPAGPTAFLRRAGMRAHLGGIGKGFAVDKAVAILRAAGLADFMVQAGGDLYVAGHRGERPWRIGIRDPRGPPDKYFASCEITDASFSTSGDYERAFIKNGRRYHHILDPSTAMPAMASRSVTIMAPSATAAEGLSKGVFILGPEKGLGMIEKIEGVGAVIVDAKNQIHVSKRLAGRIKILFPPTGGI